MNKRCRAILAWLLLFLLPLFAIAGADTWSGTGPFATGQGNRFIHALAVSADGAAVFAGSGSGTVFQYAYSDVSAPALSAVSVSGTTQTATSLSATSNEAATGYWLVLARDATAPSPAQVKAAAGYGGVSVVASGSGAMSAGVAKAFAVSGLTAATPYDLYMSAEDASANMSAAPVKVQFITLAVVDTTPDAFSFTAQTGAALSTAATSNGITVSGIDSASAISVVGGTYSINGGSYVSTPGTVNNGQTVTVRQTSSAGYSSTTTATLVIGGVSGVFNVTTLAAPTATSYTGPSATGTGSITAGFNGGGAGCAFATSQFSTASPPVGVTLTHGVFSFSTTNCGAGATLNVTLTYPQALPASTRYYKYGPEFGASQTPHWYVLPGAVVSGHQISFSITDNGVGDSNALAGFITDPGGPGVPAGAGVGVAGIPTLSEWGVLILTMLMAGLGLCVLPGRKTRTIGERWLYRMGWIND